MGRWRRTHLDGSLKSLVMRERNSQSYGVIVLEPRGQCRISTQLNFADADTAMETADALVADNYPHVCSAKTCESWETS
jgi:hypothetical protein